MAKGGSSGGGTGGTTTLKYGKANDVITVATSSLAKTTIDGGAGNDTLVLTGSNSVRIMLSDFASDPSRLQIDPTVADPHAFYFFFPDAASTIIKGSIKNVENVSGGAGDDYLSGSLYTANRLQGGAGNDHLQARGDGDVLIGGLGGDFFESDGNAVMTGGIAAGGADAGAVDSFLITWNDRATITDFEVGIDRLVFSLNSSANAQSALRVVPTADGQSVTVHFDAANASVLLQGVTTDAFESVVAEYMIGTTDSATEVFRGGAGDDFFLGAGAGANYFIINGNDMLEHITLADDYLVIASGAETLTWQEEDFGGIAGIRGVFDTDGDGTMDSSVSILLATLDQVPQIQIVTDAPLV